MLFFGSQWLAMALTHFTQCGHRDSYDLPLGYAILQATGRRTRPLDTYVRQDYSSIAWSAPWVQDPQLPTLPTIAIIDSYSGKLFII